MNPLLIAKPSWIQRLYQMDRTKDGTQDWCQEFGRDGELLYFGGKTEDIRQRPGMVEGERRFRLGLPEGLFDRKIEEDLMKPLYTNSLRLWSKRDICVNFRHFKL